MTDEATIARAGIDDAGEILTVQRAAGATRFEMCTGARSEANLRLYRRHGFVPFGHRRVDGRLEMTWLEKPASTAAGTGRSDQVGAARRSG